MIEQEPRFPNIGKELPYSVPTDFFERLPEKTLQLAKARMAKRKRNQLMIRMFALVTSAAAVILMFLVPPHRDLARTTTTTKAESIDDVLQGLSEEDLTQQTALYSAEDLENNPSLETSY